MNTAMALPGVFAACALVLAGCSSSQESSGSQEEDLGLIGDRLPTIRAPIRAPSCGGNDAGACSTGRGGSSACESDVDCVAVPQAGCCNNGWKEAVVRSQVDVYEKGGACTRAHPICPMYIVNDTRVPECNKLTHACEMVNVDDIVCGGFIVHPHECPVGYHCNLGHIPDVGGHCVSQ
ncbi:MAG TPA: hypothetical protein VMI75_21505 [Polyangiaceae bacterium]|nr:hypothetical protein [Polyangiaceae bacterium]